ncbi:hypothetical protein CcaCcLH18_04379 [Colletotrichum camelliae]|nr:hypothetical protein CcaCcLH18_04379 [Colletotrichum camelliae]
MGRVQFQKSGDDKGFFGVLRAPIGSIAGGILSTFSGAESAAMDGKSSNAVEGAIISGTIEQILRAIESKYHSFRPRLDAIAHVASPRLTECGLPSAYQQMVTGGDTEFVLEFSGPSSHDHATRLVFKRVTVAKAFL